MKQVGESFVGSGSEAAHLNTVLGGLDGPVGEAWTTALATPREGHAAFLVVAQPNMPVRPWTLFVNKATIASERHATLTWGAAQLGVASGVLDAVADGTIGIEVAESSVLIAAVWVDPAAEDADAVYANNREATYRALAAGVAGHPTAKKVTTLRDEVFNGYYQPPQGR